MKKYIITMSGATALLGFVSLQSAVAQTNTNVFPVSFRALCTSTNSGGFFQELVLNTNLITDCAADHNITNLSSLTLVFNRTNFSLQVQGTNQTVLCTPFSFSGGLTFTNTNNTALVFQQSVFVGTNLTSTGVIFGSAHWNTSNSYSSYGLTAHLNYIEPAVGTNGAAICRAILRVGADLEDEDNEGPGHPGGNGHHYGWDNPHNPHSRGH